jgi:hypothetical protein
VAVARLILFLEIEEPGTAFVTFGAVVVQRWSEPILVVETTVECKRRWTA